MGLALYDRAFVFCKGQLLGESSGGQLEYQGENQPVETLAKELAGFTPVPKRAMLRVNSFVPAAGFEFDVVDSYLKNEILTFKVQFGGSGLAMEADGWINPPSISWSATDSSKLDFSATLEALSLI